MIGSLAFAFADKAKYPKVPPEFSEHIGWLIFGFMVLMCVLAWFRSQSVRRALFALEDPRTLAVLRIGFAVMTLICFLNLEPYWRMLWSDEGIFDLAYAQDKLGRQALRGWAPVDDEFQLSSWFHALRTLDPTHVGFFDWWGVVCFLWNKPSLFFMHGSPAFVVGYMTVFFVVLLMYMCGIFSRTTGVIAWLMMSGIYNRNALYWEGTDTVYRCFWWILLFAQTGKAWSVDNWLRCRRLRAKGRLQDPNASDAYNAGKEPIYRLTPAWPRYLFMLQLAALYTTTGCVKTGSVWADGNALYYALNMDHFYRFEWYTQQVSAVFGTNVFRVMTWTTHWWEMCFPLLLVGVSLHFTLRHKNEPWYRAQDVWWRRWGARLTLVGLWGLLWRMNVLVLPFCLAMDGDNPQDASGAIAKMNIVYGVAIPAYALLWYVLGKWPVRVGAGLKALVRWIRPLGVIERLIQKIPVVRDLELTITQETLRRYTLGRRVWLTLGFMFHGNLILFMNIGMFPFIMLMTYAGFVHGHEMHTAFVRVRWGMQRIPLLRRLVRGKGHWLYPAQSHRSVRVRGRKINDGVVLLLGLCGAALVYAKVEQPEFIEDLGSWVKLWFAAIVAAAVVHWYRSPSRGELALHRSSGPALAYTAIGRSFVLLAVVYHATTIALTLWPSYPVFTFRSKAKAAIHHSDYVRGSATSQSWRMFAPNPPRSNSFMKTVVVEDDGDEWDLKNNAFDYRPNPWIFNDRMRKMQRRMVGKGKWYLRYWSHFQCREWALEHEEVPEKIVITKLVTRIPGPDKVAEKGPYHPRKLRVREHDVQDHKCTGDGELPAYMLERRGLEVTAKAQARADKDDEARERKYETRREQWAKRKDYGRWAEARAEKAERERKVKERSNNKRSERIGSHRKDRIRPKHRGADPEPAATEARGVEDDGARD